MDDKPFIPTDITDISASVVRAHWRKLQADFVAMPSTGSMALSGHPLTVNESETVRVADEPPRGDSEIVIAFELLDFAEPVEEGKLIRAVTPMWMEILDRLAEDPQAVFELTPRQFEELVAGRYEREGASVILTPPSGDGGKDIIATFPHFGSIRILDQVKLYKPGHRVTAEEVRAMCHVLNRDRRASKAFVTTTSTFAPGVYDEFKDDMPSRLQLRDGRQLMEWLSLARAMRRST